MANAVQDIIALGRKLEAAQAQFERVGSVDRACAEAEARLAKLRGQEAEAEAEFRSLCERRKVEADRYILACDARYKKAQEDAAEKQTSLLELYRVEAAKLEEPLVAARESLEKVLSRTEAAEAEETRLAQSVTALKAELAAIRARVLG